jgi:hypothetical protein
MRRTKWDDSKVELLREMVRAGLSQRKIADSFGVTIASISYAMRHHNIRRDEETIDRLVRAGRPVEWDDDALSELRDMIESGMSRAEIAIKMGRTRRSINAQAYLHKIRTKKTQTEKSKEGTERTRRITSAECPDLMEVLV